MPLARASAGAAAGVKEPAGGARSRRTHRKSRDGCTECKRRHIRCDQGRPACVNCHLAERACSFLERDPASRWGGDGTGDGTGDNGRRAGHGRHEPVHNDNGGTGILSNGWNPPQHGHPGQPRHGEGTELQPTPAPAPVPSHSPADLSQDPRMRPDRLNISTMSSMMSASPEPEPRDGRDDEARYQPLFHTLPSLVDVFTASTSNAPSPASPQNAHVSPRPSSPPSAFSVRELILLHHACTAMDGCILGRNKTQFLIDMVLRCASTNPYALDQVLAFSALHLARLHPQSADAFRHHATELQTRALASFNREAETPGTTPGDATTSGGSDTAGVAASTPAASDSNPKPVSHDAVLENTSVNDSPAQGGSGGGGDRNSPGSDGFVPRFLFASMLSLHVLAETLAYHRADFQSFLDRLVDCMGLHRGVRAVIHATWADMMHSDLRPFLLPVREANNIAKNGHRGQECDGLLSLLAASDLSPASAVACREAAECLQWAFDVDRQLPDEGSPQPVAAFSVIAPSEFVAMVRRRQPEALVVLAYFGVLIHRGRTLWVFEDSGAFIVRAMANHLGSFWADALRWPLEQLETDGSTTATPMRS